MEEVDKLVNDLSTGKFIRVTNILKIFNFWIYLYTHNCKLCFIPLKYINPQLFIQLGIFVYICVKYKHVKTISFCVFDRMIHENPTKWMTLENNDEEMIHLLSHLNNWISKDEIQRLFISDIPQNTSIFYTCDYESLISLREEIILNLN